MKKYYLVGGLVIIFIIGGAIITKNLFYKSPTTPVSEKIDNGAVFIINQNDPEAIKRITTALKPFGVDEKTLAFFSPNSAHYVRDKDSVYWIFAKPQKIEGADPDTFTTYPLGGNIFAYDRDHVYITHNVVPNANPDTFTAVGTSDWQNNMYYKDDKTVYYKVLVNNMTDYSYALTPIPDADPKTIRTFSYYSTSILAADNTHVYVGGKPVQGIDGKTFSMISEPFYHDKNGAYFFSSIAQENLQGPLLRLSDSPNVQVLSNDLQWGGYAIIGNEVFMSTSTIKGADASSFHLLDSDTSTFDNPSRKTCTENCVFGADNNSVYYKTEKIIGADTGTFELVGYGQLFGVLDYGSKGLQPSYGRDKAHVFYLGEEVAGASPTTFTPIVSGAYWYDYGKDENSVFWKSKKIEHADPKTFRPLDGQQSSKGGCRVGYYGIDATGAYYQNNYIESADPATFKAIGDGSYAQDAQHYYKGAQIIDKTEVQNCEYGLAPKAGRHLYI